MTDHYGYADLSPEQKEAVARQTIGDSEYERRQAGKVLNLRRSDKNVLGKELPDIPSQPT